MGGPAPHLHEVGVLWDRGLTGAGRDHPVTIAGPRSLRKLDAERESSRRPSGWKPEEGLLAGSARVAA